MEEIQINTFENQVDAVLTEIRETLVAKNKAYGNSALCPMRVFSSADPVAQILVRIDDKLSRIARGSGQDTEDTVTDLMGYLVLLKIAEKNQHKLPAKPFSIPSSKPSRK